MRKKFEIISDEPPYQPHERVMPSFKTIERLGSNCETAEPMGHRLYISKEAMSHIGSHIGWGKMTQHNCIEQGGILLGQVFRDSVNGVTYGVADVAVAALSARGSSVHLEMTHDTWKEMLASVDQLLEQSPQRDLQVIGWYHTHPNGLQVYMSGIDRETQGRLFAHDWQFAVVLNPQKERWRAFFGHAAQECQGYVLAGNEEEVAIEDVKTVSLVEAQPNQADSQVSPVEAPPESEPDFRERLRSWFDNPRRLLRACLIMLFMILTFQILMIAMLAFNPRFWR
jgi:hypothetical protein